MRFRLHTLLILLAIGPPMLAGSWTVVEATIEQYRQRQLDAGWEQPDLAGGFLPMVPVDVAPVP